MSNEDAMVGLFFHSRDEAGLIEWQGCVDARMGEGLYLVTTFSWFDGSDHNKKLIPLEDMRTWTFYADTEDMREAWRRQAAKWSRELEDSIWREPAP